MKWGGSMCRCPPARTTIYGCGSACAARSTCSTSRWWSSGGGHADQLSAAPGLDRYRIQSLAKILSRETLTPSQAKAAAAMLRQKCRIYATGCRKRGNNAEAKVYEALAAKYADGH